MKRFLLVLILLLAPNMVFAIGPNYTARSYSGIQTKNFRNGESPYPTYNGLTFISVRDDSLNIRFGDGSFAADSLCFIGNFALGENITYSQSYILFKPDLSILGDSVIITSSILRLALWGDSSLTATGSSIATARLYLDIDNSTTWAHRKTSPADSAWTHLTTHVGPTDITAAWTSYYFSNGFTTNLSSAVRWNSNIDGNDYPHYDFGSEIIYYPFGPDSCYSSYSITAGAGRIMVDPSPDVLTPLKTLGSDLGNQYIDIDLTHLTDMWHTGKWMAVGVRIGTFGIVTDETPVLGQPYDSKLAFISNSANNINLRPKLTIKYINIKKGSSSYLKMGFKEGL